MKRVCTTAKRIQEYRDKYNLTLVELSNKTGIPAQTLNRYELGQRVPKIDVANDIADKLNINPMWLIGYDVPMETPRPIPNEIPYSSARYAPILGTIPAGAPVLAVEDIEGYATVPYNDDEDYFYLRVNGESMKGAGIQTGDLVLIRRQPCADDGQIVACRVNGDEATLKRYKRQGNTVLLLPENPDFEPRIVPISDFESGAAEIIGVAVEFRRML